MKKTLVVLLALVMVFAFAATAMAADKQYVPYADIQDMENVGIQTAIERLSVLGALKGYDAAGTTFAPNQLITREEFATVAVRLAGLEDQVELYAALAPAFSDVPDGYWSEGYINAAKDNGLMIGRSATTFDRTTNVTMQEVVTVALRLVGYDSRLPGDWPQEFNDKAVAVNLAKYFDFVGPKYATRGEVASLMNEAINLYKVHYVENSIAQGIGQAFYSNTALDTDEVGLLDANFGISYVDADGYAYVTRNTNEDGKTHKVSVLYDTYKAYVTYGYFADDQYAFSETTGWGFDDFEAWELLFFFANDIQLIDSKTADYDEISVASLYGVSAGGNVTDFGWQDAALTVFDNGSTRKGNRIGDEVCYVEFLGKVERTDDAEKDFEIASKNDIFKLDDNDYETILEKGAYGELWYEEDGALVAVKDFSYFEDAPFGIVDSSNETSVTFKNSHPASITSNIIDGKLNLKKQDIAFFLMGEGFINAEDLEAGDVIYLDEQSLDDDYYSSSLSCYDDKVEVALVWRAELGSLGKLGSNYVTIDDVKYGAQMYSSPYALNSFYSLNLGRSVFVYNQMALINTSWSSTVMWVPSYAFVNFAYVIDDVQNSGIGVLNKYIFSEGDRHLYQDAATTETITGMEIIDANGDEIVIEFKDKIRVNAAKTDGYPNEGSLVEYYTDKEDLFTGWVRHPDNFHYIGHMFGWTYLPGNLLECLNDAMHQQIENPTPLAGYDSAEFNDFVSVSFTNKSAMVVAYEILHEDDVEDDAYTFIGDAYRVADDAVVYLVKSYENAIGYEIDSAEVISGADLKADGDFTASDVCVYEMNGDEATIIYIADYDKTGVEEFGFGFFLPGDFGQVVVDDGDNYYFVTVGNKDIIVPGYIVGNLSYFTNANATLIFYRTLDGKVKHAEDVAIVDWCEAINPALLSADKIANLQALLDGLDGNYDLVCGNITAATSTTLTVNVGIAFNGTLGSPTINFSREPYVAYDLTNPAHPVEIEEIDEDLIGEHVVLLIDKSNDLSALMVVDKHNPVP